ncbi:MAG TPA: LLM class flavin-dependent oxidoreductase [Trueperaceae bacterium]
MKVPLSVLDLVPVPAGSSAGRAFRNSIELAKLADELGYVRYWVAEHHNTESFASSATEIIIGLLARETDRIRVGSGGIMLPNHSPLKVAENFLTLEALYPGRIDLGLGRAPGTDQLTALALRRSAELLGAEDFPQQIEAIRAHAGEASFPEGHPLNKVKAGPAGVPLPPIWLLGSSTFGAQLAARLGRGYAFAFHFSPDHAVPAMRLYREGFRPSEHLEQPHAILGVSVVCASTEERADELARTHDLLWLRIRRGERGPLPTPEEAAAYRFSAEELQLVEASRRMLVWGSPEQVRERLLELARELQANELMITSHIASHEDRLESYRLLAQTFAGEPAD